MAAINPVDFKNQVFSDEGVGRVVRWCWVNFQCRGVLLIWIRVGQGPTALAVGAGGGCLDIFPLVYPISLLSPSFWETARYRLKYCLKGSLSPKQPTNQPTFQMNFVKVLDTFIGVGRFKIWGGGQGLEYWGGPRGANSQQAHDAVTTSHRRRIDVMCPLGF